MSSSDDSEAKEWEREQMLRGTQSRRQKCQQPQVERDTGVDAAVAKNHVSQDIERVKGTIESIKRSIGSTRVEIVKSEKRIDAFKKRIEKLESSNSFFDEISSLSDTDEILKLLDKHRSIITGLPHDQKEMIDLLEKKLKDHQPPMNVDQ